MKAMEQLANDGRILGVELVEAGSPLPPPSEPEGDKESDESHNPPRRRTRGAL